MTLEEMRINYAKGIVGVKPLFYTEISNKVQQLITVGLTKPEAVLRVQSMVGVSRATVYRALQFVSRL